MAQFPEEKILIYNGALHNMTRPPKPISVPPPNFTLLEELTYAPEAIEKWGNNYGALNLFNFHRPLPSSHYRIMQSEADPNQITCFQHGVNELTFYL